MLRKYFIPYTTKVIKSVLILTCVRMWFFFITRKWGAYLFLGCCTRDL